MEKELMIHPKSKQEWREWLEKNHDKFTKIGVIKYKKHTGKPTISHQEAMHEAICFGWIDTTIRRLDDDRYVRFFARRNKNSRWSSATVGYAKSLIKQKKMHPAGLQFYKEGLKKPLIDEGRSANPTMPKELKEALEKNTNAKSNFEKFAPSYKKIYFRWIESAKLSETKERRVKEVIQRASDNKAKWL